MTNVFRERLRGSKAFTLVELLVVIAIIGILVALLLPAIQAAREAARRAQCQSNTHNVALAVLNYESARKTFPIGMKYTSTASVQTLAAFGPNWMIDILPYMEEQTLRDAFNPASLKAPYLPAINDATNSVARGTTIPALLCPSDGYNRVLYKNHGGNWARGNYAASAGRSFIYGTPGQASTAGGYMNGLDGGPGWNAKDVTSFGNGVDYTCQRGVIGPNASVELRQIKDGTSKTIMLGEIRAGLTELDARGCWALAHAGGSLIAGYGGGSDANGPNAPWSNSDDVPTENTGAAPVCGTPTDGNQGAEKMTSNGGSGFDQAGVRSKHPGGVHVAMCDGSVDFISDDIETTGCYNPDKCCTVWDWMITSADGGRGGAFQNDKFTGTNPCK